MSSEHDSAVLNAIFNPLLLTETDINDERDLKDEEEDSEITATIRAIEREGIQAAELGKTDDALATFNKVIEMAPTRASGFNNRAQVHRLQGDTQGALQDLNIAIELSRGQGLSACQAFCQRGLIYWKTGNIDKARQDFENAAQLGSKFAKSQLVKLNPYAAMCNQMLQTVFNNLYA